MKKDLFAVVAAIGMLGGVQATNLVTIGGFEDPVTSNPFEPIPSGSRPALASWPIDAGGVDIVRSHLIQHSRAPRRSTSSARV